MFQIPEENRACVAHALRSEHFRTDNVHIVTERTEPHAQTSRLNLHQHNHITVAGILSDGLRVSVVNPAHNQHSLLTRRIDRPSPGEQRVRLGRTCLTLPCIHIMLSRPGFELRAADDVTILQH